MHDVRNPGPNEPNLHPPVFGWAAMCFDQGVLNARKMHPISFFLSQRVSTTTAGVMHHWEGGLKGPELAQTCEFYLEPYWAALLSLSRTAVLQLIDPDVSYTVEPWKSLHENTLKCLVDLLVVTGDGGGSEKLLESPLVSTAKLGLRGEQTTTVLERMGGQKMNTLGDGRHGVNISSYSTRLSPHWGAGDSRGHRGQGSNVLGHSGDYRLGETCPMRDSPETGRKLIYALRDKSMNMGSDKNWGQGGYYTENVPKHKKIGRALSSAQSLTLLNIIIIHQRCRKVEKDCVRLTEYAFPIDSCYDGGSSKPTRTQLQAFKKTHDIDDTIPGPEARFILSEQCSARGDIGRRDLGASGLNGIGGRLRRRWGCGIRELPSFWVQSGFMYEVGVKKTLRGTHLILRHLELDSLNTDEPPAIESDAEDTDFLCQSLLCGIQRWILGAPSATFTSEFWHSGFWTILQLLRQPKTAGVFPASGARAMSAEWDKLIPTIYTPALLNSFLATISAHAAIPGVSPNESSNTENIRFLPLLLKDLFNTTLSVSKALSEKPNLPDQALPAYQAR
ncbi:hypothetical protein DFH09DRAFT_1089086 [Mycena vulgaris]|nr:hypothetical protein DFH09DRAFT_1089086 [Mycena vulgaris]